MYINLGLVKHGFNVTDLISNYVFENLRSKIFLQKRIRKNTKYCKFDSSPKRLFEREEKKITACIDPDWMPLEGFEKGTHVEGISAEYGYL